MIFKVGGCFGSESPGFHSVGFLVNGTLLLEGGTVTSTFSLEEQKAIEDILISHIHLDHTKELFFLVDNLAPLNLHTITFSGVEAVVDGVKKYLFNEQLWPDFTRLPNVRKPVLRFQIIPENEYTGIHDLDIKPVKVNHPVPSTGYILREPGCAVVYTGDTGPTRRIWEEARAEQELKAVLAETSFPNGMEELAVDSGHLTPSLLVKELDHLGRPEVPVYVFHMKPMYLDRIREELELITKYKVQLLKQKMTYTF
ncbi:3',5'-cyclic-nucleotide phosphodiesterase [bacterium]|jgi:cAMP phosphodiesterase|nr:3',5'-cyclic-nucleotide phosphodiesterase [bacterium]